MAIMNSASYNMWCEFVACTDYDLVNNRKAYAKNQVLQKPYFIIILCGELISQLFSKMFYIKVLSLFLIESHYFELLFYFCFRPARREHN